MALRLRSDDAAALKCLLLLAILYALMSALAYSVSHMKHVRPLPPDAPPARFSEGRALHHVRELAHRIPSRQEGQPGLEEAARYLSTQLRTLADRAGPNFRIEIDESLINGSFNMVFLGRSISFAYRNHINIAVRIASPTAEDSDPAVLVNGHFDSPLGSPGAGDCASCVASMLELCRLMIDSKWVPPRPIIFLFNGAEELFLLGSHGFMTKHKWRTSIGAFINIEASGSGGIDLVCQSGPGSWPSRVYSQSAVYPMAHSAAQDIFPLIPGDTDFRIFSQDYGDIPGLDIIFVLGGYYYHTAYDTVERLLPGSIQARGENLFNLIKAFANSLLVDNAHGVSNETNNVDNERAVFFDYLTWFMIFYSRRISLILHSLPVVIFTIRPLFLCYSDAGVASYFAVSFGMIKGMVLHITGVFLGVVFPIACSTLRLLVSSHSMNWFAHPYLAFFMFVPSSIAGLLIPKYYLQKRAVGTTASKVLADEAQFWGCFGYYALFTLVYLLSGLSGGFLTFFTSACMIPAWISYCLLKRQLGHQSHQSLKLALAYVLPLTPILVYSVYFGGFLIQFLVEKMGMMGALPLPYGYFVQDIIVAATIGLVTGWCLGPLTPIVNNWLARSVVLKILIQFTVISLAVASQFFPYSAAAPKRVILQHTLLTSENLIVESAYDFSVVDSNALSFVFKNAPEAAKEIDISAGFSYRSVNQSDHSRWLALFPVSFLFSGSLKFPAKANEILKHYEYVPSITPHAPSTVSNITFRKVFMELNLGSLKEVWVAVINITGPLSNWSFADHSLPASEVINGGPSSYICRLSGKSNKNWTFWLEANSSAALRVDVAVLDQYLTESSKKLKRLFPSWVDVTAYSSFLSSYYV